MSIIMENQNVKAAVCFKSNGLCIDFDEDSSFVRSESVLIDLSHRSIGIIFENAYHHIGDLPNGMLASDLEGMANVRLTGSGAGGREFTLNAPIKILRKTA